jgi:hypothetical protein
MLIEQSIDVRRVMDDLVVAAELRELVADLVKAVRAARHDGRDRIPIECRDRVLREHLVQVFVPHSARRVAVAVLFLPEDREPDAACLQDAREGDRDLLRSIVERPHATDPE